MLVNIGLARGEVKVPEGEEMCEESLNLVLVEDPLSWGMVHYHPLMDRQLVHSEIHRSVRSMYPTS